jgi:hypothetical protein
MHKSSIKPSIDVTLENGSSNLFTKKFKYENIIDDKDIRFQDQLFMMSIFWKVGWYPHKAFL